MNTFEKHFLDFPAFVEMVMSWEPDFLVPVAKKGCKLIKTVENLPQLCSNPELIKYRSFFELTNPPVQGKNRLNPYQLIQGVIASRRLISSVVPWKVTRPNSRT